MKNTKLLKIHNFFFKLFTNIVFTLAIIFVYRQIIIKNFKNDLNVQLLVMYSIEKRTIIENKNYFKMTKLKSLN